MKQQYETISVDVQDNESDALVANSAPENKLSKSHSTAWLTFYTCVRFPLGIVANIGYLILYCLNNYFNEISVSTFLVFLFLIIYQTITCIQMLRFKSSGYYMNIGLLFIEAVVDSLQSVSTNNYGDSYLIFIVSLLLFSIIWIVPNFIYFYKRRDMYSIKIVQKKSVNNVISKFNKQDTSLAKPAMSTETKVKIALMVAGIFALVCVGIYFIAHSIPSNYGAKEPSLQKAIANNATVYYTDDGKKYHSNRNCPSLNHSQIITGSSILNISKNREPCELCWDFDS